MTKRTRKSLSILKVVAIAALPVGIYFGVKQALDSINFEPPSEASPATKVEQLPADPPRLTIDPSCYDRTNLRTIGRGDWSGCAGMLIADYTQLRQVSAQGSGSWAITGPDGLEYTLADSERNIFTGQITDFAYLFAGDGSENDFNGDIGYLDTSNVTTLHRSFDGNIAFDQDISTWDTSSVIRMGYTFNATRFNQPIGAWNVSSVTNMLSMFGSNLEFNQDLSQWDTRNVTFCNGFHDGATSWIEPKPVFDKCRN